MKFGRNTPCHCGSGLKYKKCCLDSDKQGTPVLTRDASGRLVGRKPIETNWKAQGKIVRVVGDKVAISEPHITRHEFFLDHLYRELGQDWWNAQQKLPEGQRHPVERWWNLMTELQAGKVKGFEVSQEGERLYKTELPGDAKALMCLAYDVYTASDALALPAALLKRLRHKDQFQGARYELAVAAVFIRAGFELEWIVDTSRKLPEFIARRDKTEIAVEAKSRHRRGVLGRSGEPPDVGGLEVDVEGLLARALEKETDGRPYVICLDLNLPSEETHSAEDWIFALESKVLSEHSYENTGDREPFSAVLFTNYSWHWQGREPTRNPIEIAVRANKAEVPLPLKEFEPIGEAVMQYGYVPDREGS